MKLLFTGYYRLLKLAMTLLLAAMIIPVILQILSRFDTVPRYIWTEEVARFCFVWIIMLGSVVAVRDSSHFDVDLLPHPKTTQQEGVSKFIVHGAMLLMAIVFSWYGFEFARFGAKQTSEMSGINMLAIYSSFPLAGVSWIVFIAEKLAEDIRLIVSPQVGDPQ